MCEESGFMPMRHKGNQKREQRGRRSSSVQPKTAGVPRTRLRQALKKSSSHLRKGVGRGIGIWARWMEAIAVAFSLLWAGEAVTASGVADQVNQTAAADRPSVSEGVRASASRPPIPLKRLALPFLPGMGHESWAPGENVSPSHQQGRGLRAPASQAVARDTMFQVPSWMEDDQWGGLVVRGTPVPLFGDFSYIGAPARHGQVHSLPVQTPFLGLSMRAEAAYALPSQSSPLYSPIGVEWIRF
jgi:hypothetical protein